MTDTQPLFETLDAGALALPSRIVMAPLTRNRAQADGTPSELAIAYYRQRASAGLIITEATQISPMGKGYLDTPGIHADAHVDAWRRITDAVHEAGGRIVLQLWHVGRISHVSLLPGNAQPVSPTTRRAEAQTFTANGFEPVSAPVALDAAGIAATVADYAAATHRARAAGFDGVEIHAANGYLIDQFLQDGVNDRTDGYGGSVANRLRFLTEVIDAVTGAWDAAHVGIRLSPLGSFNDMRDSDPAALFGAAYRLIADRQLAYLHVVERFGAPLAPDRQAILDAIRPHFTGVYIANGGFDGASAAARIAAGSADAVSFGIPFIANPDLPARIARGGPFNEPDQATFYGGGAKGYTDYPSLTDAAIPA